MVSTCANPKCSVPFRTLHTGRLFLVDPRERQRGVSNEVKRLDCYWLCDHCAELFTLEFGPTGEVSCITRPSGFCSSDQHDRRSSIAAV